MKVFIEKQNKKVKFVFEGTGTALIKKLKYNSEEVLVIKNGELVSLDEKLTNKDTIKIISIISGG
ncbi:thiamine biosynthesis protein ThiS [Candidatus Woesearchaeota archaeon CG10_big_fil_rev_8_21_14_0_10_32_9]|nr:MAG: thiamine biosynthesis protein ThiS [Candidatus Woesearchaeota archaeon CG10_big_fil_rev_8_21_14_0_10_32_9]